MHQHITQSSLSEDFILVCDGAAELKARYARRLSVHPCANGELILPEDLSCLRTLAVFPADATSLASYEVVLKFDKYKVLRVLDLKECAHLSDDHIWEISHQVLMKYLSINPGSINTVTRKIGELEQLETLDLSGKKIVTVYKEVLLLPKLKHLFGKFQLSARDSVSLGWKLKTFLRDDSVLETLAGFIIGVGRGLPQLMILMRRLRTVKIWCESNTTKRNRTDIKRAIAEFIHKGIGQPDLNRSLSVDFQRCSTEFVNDIKTKAGDMHILASLKLRGNLSEFPQFVAQLKSIVELCLSFTSLSWKKIRDGLSTVKGLKYLKLIEDDLVSLDILSDTVQLKAVERIYVVCKKRLETAITVNQLVSVHILCRDLHVIPDKSLIDIANMENLKEVGLHDQVTDTIKDDLRQAAAGRTSTVEFSFLEYPS